jgi:4-hydroxy-tetrahydrodipicolinate synthase
MFAAVCRRWGENTCRPRYPQVTSRIAKSRRARDAFGFDFDHPRTEPLKKLVGSICALATPFRGDALDLDAFAQLIEYQLGGGTQALVVAGSTGEAHALDNTEFDRLLAFAVERVRRRVPVLAGTGSANTRKTIAATRRAQNLGADAALVVTPYYVRPTQEGLRQHYLAVADEGGLPVVLYNVPSRTGCDLLPETVAKLSGHERIVGIKEARGENERVASLVALKNPHFSILSGDDPTCARAMLAGAEGVISVAANVAPRQLRDLCDAAIAGDARQAQARDSRLVDLYTLIGVEPNPIPVKWCLHELGLGAAEPRLPLLPLSTVHHANARGVLHALQLSAVQAPHSSAA